ncbi:PQQ-dependent sugar dehydrogenase [Pendulispora brunnea]|uniref:PQQ-dependent sugar dehydrogenase n=1 Tax=Pendulispora brunnea TaxID=2905690 RepID=A0ABZ2K0D6_9BACT
MKRLVLSTGAWLAFAGCAPSDSADFEGAVTLAAVERHPPVDTCVGTAPYDAWVADPKLCVYVFATGLGRPRQMAFAPNGDLFVNNRSVTVLWDDDKNGTSDATETGTFATAEKINHGLAFSPDGRFLYASSQTTVYRWAYTWGARTASGPPEVVVKNLPGGSLFHVTRTLVFDPRGRLYVNVGAMANVDETEDLWKTRAQVRRFSLPSSIPDGGIDYAEGEVMGSGLRNEVALFVDRRGRLWGAENGREGLTDPDFGDIHDDNPGEEINLIEDRGGPSFYGYPFCWTEFHLAGGAGAGSQWADQTLPEAIRKTDAWCRDARIVRRPVFVMQAHWAPLGLFQYTGHALPFFDDFLVGSHGSIDRTPATGKLIARAKYRYGKIVSVEPIVGEKGPDGNLAQGVPGAPRPVDIRQAPDGAVYYSDDFGGRIFKIGYRR